MRRPIACPPAVWLAIVLLAVCPLRSVQQVPNVQEKYIGCFVDSSQRILSDLECVEGEAEECPSCAAGGSSIDEAGTGVGCQNNDMTIDLCLSLCSERMYVYAGLESGIECYCGNVVSPAIPAPDMTQCNTPCGGNTTQKCGAEFLIDVYDLRKSCVINDLGDFLSASQNTMFDNEAVVFDTDTTLTFTCQSGYALSGQGSSTCQEDGSWIPSIPTCVESGALSDVTCPPLTVPSQGAITPSQTFYRGGQSATFSCKSGYVLQGPSQLTCGTDGQWNPRNPPTCIEKLCPEPDPLENGKWALSGPKREVGVAVIYSCVDGFVFDPENESIMSVWKECNDDFQWEGNGIDLVCVAANATDVDTGSSTGPTNNMGGNNPGGGNGSNCSPSISWITVLSWILVITFKQGWCSSV